MKKLYQYINGNKTIIFMSAATIMQQAVNVGLLNDTKLIQFGIGLSLTFGGGSLVHHAKKGYFSRNKGN